MVLPSKEASVYSAECTASFIDRCGITSTQFRTDGEPSIVKLSDMAKAKRSHSTILPQAPKHSSASIGAAERAHWEVQAQTRILVSAVEAEVPYSDHLSSPALAMGSAPQCMAYVAVACAGLREDRLL